MRKSIKARINECYEKNNQGAPELAQNSANRSPLQNDRFIYSFHLNTAYDLVYLARIRYYKLQIRTQN